MEQKSISVKSCFSCLKKTGVENWTASCHLQPTNNGWAAWKGMIHYTSAIQTFSAGTLWSIRNFWAHRPKIKLNRQTNKRRKIKNQRHTHFFFFWFVLFISKILNVMVFFIHLKLVHFILALPTLVIWQEWGSVLLMLLWADRMGDSKNKSENSK